MWFIRKNTPLNLSFFLHLIGLEKTLTKVELLKIAQKRIERLEVASAIEDIIYYVRDQAAITRTWSKDLFRHWIEKNQTEERT